MTNWIAKRCELWWDTTSRPPKNNSFLTICGINKQPKCRECSDCADRDLPFAACVTAWMMTMADTKCSVVVFYPNGSRLPVVVLWIQQKRLQYWMALAGWSDDSNGVLVKKLLPSCAPFWSTWWGWFLDWWTSRGCVMECWECFYHCLGWRYCRLLCPTTNGDSLRWLHRYVQQARPNFAEWMTWVPFRNFKEGNMGNQKC